VHHVVFLRVSWHTLGFAKPRHGSINRHAENNLLVKQVVAAQSPSERNGIAGHPSVWLHQKSRETFFQHKIYLERSDKPKWRIQNCCIDCFTISFFFLSAGQVSAGYRGRKPPPAAKKGGTNRQRQKPSKLLLQGVALATHQYRVHANHATSQSFLLHWSMRTCYQSNIPHIRPGMKWPSFLLICIFKLIRSQWNRWTSYSIHHANGEKDIRSV